MPALELEPTTDVLGTLAEHRSLGQVLVGFAAEHGSQAVQYGREKLSRKRLDAIIINDISDPEIGFDQAENEVTIVTPHSERHVARASKQLIAAAVLDEVQQLLEAREGARAGARAGTGSAARV